jgi:hypothetical protein
VTPARVAPVDPAWPTSTVRAVDHSVVLETH